ncbi:Leupeptin-inactivating enzyme 1 precursor [Stieleria bergensis]|uniref:Vacuolar membrane protease n=1 Tax=Stieleria bergensis TaxID=2528025 RepID=A0A517SS64_9BACT|nr:Leupeptin-inactivating enzyme 1 precursor [Planctomycetes bacterium SV_7m_r]
MRTAIAFGAFLFALLLGLLAYRGPAPKPASAAISATRMAQRLQHLIGPDLRTHSSGTAAGKAFLDRLQAELESLNVQTRRLTWTTTTPKTRTKPHAELAAGAELTNLLATLPGQQPDLAPILIVTHHDSCPWGPGAGDAGSCVVALVEHCRMLSQQQASHQRTVHYLFTDSEEYGLVGAKHFARSNPLPIATPAFVLNFDARGTSGGVPMFEINRVGHESAKTLLGGLARPKITSSLAVTVYRQLPNKTDFTIWRTELDQPGFNFATIGGAHRYHTPQDSPENVSRRTLQHMGDHITSMHRRLDRLSDQQLANLFAKDNSEAIFFDVFGAFVVNYPAWLQTSFAAASCCMLFVLWWLIGNHRTAMGWAQIQIQCLCLLAAIAIGLGLQGLLLATAFRSVRYTPYDLPLGLFTIGLALAAAWTVRDWGIRKWKRLPLSESDLRTWQQRTWLLGAAFALVVAWRLPGGAYLLSIPVTVFSITATVVTTRIGTRPQSNQRRQRALASLPSWTGWLAVCVLVAPVLVLLVQALGPWRLPLYAGIAGVLAMIMPYQPVTAKTA